MKTILFLVSSIVSSFLTSGCAITTVQKMVSEAYRDAPPPAGIDVLNNLDKTIVIYSTRSSGPLATLRPGEQARVGVCGLMVGSNITVTARVYDQAGRYIGVAQYRTSVYLDGGYRYNDTWTVDYFNPLRS